MGTVISGNQAMEGGGVGLDSTAGNSFGAINSQIISNTAAVNGGGIHTREPVGLVDFAGMSRLAHNHAGQHGGGVFSSGLHMLGLGAPEAGDLLRVEANSAGVSGGGLYAKGPANVFLADVSSGPGDDGSALGNLTLEDNWADSDGGGLYVSGGRYIRSRDPDVACGYCAGGGLI